MTNIMSALRETYLYGGGCQMDDEHLSELMEKIDSLQDTIDDLSLDNADLVDHNIRLHQENNERRLNTCSNSSITKNRRRKKYGSKSNARSRSVAD